MEGEQPFHPTPPILTAAGTTNVNHKEVPREPLVNNCNFAVRDIG